MSLVHVLLGPADFDDQIPDRENCVYWHDDLSVGPVPTTQSLEDLSRIRETFWKTFFSDSDEPGETGELTPPTCNLAQRDEQIRRLAESSEVIVWGALNRREVLVLFALLNFLDLNRARSPRITVASCAKWGPQVYRAEQLAEFLGARWLITPEFMALSREAWGCYTAPDPMGLNNLATRLRDQDNPALGNVLSRILEEYPSVSNGLSQVEEKMLQRAREETSIVKIVAHTMVTSEECLGDFVLYDRISEFAFADVPVLELIDGETLRRALLGPAYVKARARLTDFGKQLLSGACDYVSINGLDHWIGGVHLRGHSVRWRYDPDARRLACA